jgi:ATP-dependent RNA helicase SUPV3L1/SUV3
MDSALKHLDKEQRSLLRRAGIVVGVLDLFHAGLLKPGAALWRMALLAARSGKPMLPLPPAGAVLLASGERLADMGARVAGFRSFGPQMLRIDLAERMARAAHEAIGKGQPFTAADPQVVSLGLLEPGFLQMMRAAGFRPVSAPPPAAAGVEGEAPVVRANWAFRGRPKPVRPREAEPAAAPSGGQAFAGLAALLGRNG